MATAPPLPPPASAPLRETRPQQESIAEQGLVPSPQVPQEEEPIALNSPVARLPVEVDVSIPVREFRVRHLLTLEPGKLIETRWTHGEDMPLSAGDVQLAWSEFEVIDTQLAVRVTRLV